MFYKPPVDDLKKTHENIYSKANKGFKKYSCVI